MRVEIFENGSRLFSGLIDDGSNVMRFESGLGFVTKDQCKANHWQIKPAA